VLDGGDAVLTRWATNFDWLDGDIWAHNVNLLVSLELERPFIPSSKGGGRFDPEGVHEVSDVLVELLTGGAQLFLESPRVAFRRNTGVDTHPLSLRNVEGVSERVLAFYFSIVEARFCERFSSLPVELPNFVDRLLDSLQIVLGNDFLD
jgi:hypothetical protein